jgi:DNA-binding CsgD family transcriptional regulator
VADLTDYDARNREIAARLVAGATHQQVAREFGLSKQRIGQLRLLLTGRPHSERPPKWPVERTRMLAKLWHQGLSCSQIGQRLGVSKDAVLGKARRLDLPIRVPGNARR